MKVWKVIYFKHGIAAYIQKAIFTPSVSFVHHPFPVIFSNQFCCGTFMKKKHTKTRQQSLGSKCAQITWITLIILDLWAHFRNNKNTVFAYDFQLLLLERFRFLSFPNDKNDSNKIVIIPFFFVNTTDRPTNYGWIFFHRENKFIQATVFIWAQETKNIFLKWCHVPVNNGEQQYRRLKMLPRNRETDDMEGRSLCVTNTQTS